MIEVLPVWFLQEDPFQEKVVAKTGLGAIGVERIYEKTDWMMYETIVWNPNERVFVLSQLPSLLKDG